ncbi:MAG: ATP synthase F0 subunit A, partial [Salinimicrobium sp.]
MQKENVAKFFLACLFTFVSLSTQANPYQEEGHEKEPRTQEAHAESGGDAKVNTREEVQEYIDHHLKDSHYVTFYSDAEEGTHAGFPLPVILWDNGLKVFSAGKFHHGEEIAEVDGNYYRLYHT